MQNKSRDTHLNNALELKTLTIDNWIIVEEKYKKSGYINYNFGANVDISTIWSTIGSIVNICTVAILSVGKVYKTHTFERLEEIVYKKSTPCEDLALIKELDNEINEFKFYNLFFRNCQHWISWCYNIDVNSSEKCCNPDGPLFEE